MLYFTINPLLRLLLVSTNDVRDFRSVYAIHKLCGQVVAQILHNIRCGVNVAMAGDSMVAEAVSVLHTQVQTLDREKKKAADLFVIM